MHNPIRKDDDTRRVIIDKARIATMDLSTALVLEAKQMVDDFIDERRILQAKVQTEEYERAQFDSRLPKNNWWCLHMYWRRNKDSLDLGWQQAHWVKGKLKYVYIRRKDGNYDQRHLKSLANAIEWELVQQFEQRARELRADWKRVVVIRTNLRCLSGKNHKPGEADAA